MKHYVLKPLVAASFILGLNVGAIAPAKAACLDQSCEQWCEWTWTWEDFFQGRYFGYRLCS